MLEIPIKQQANLKMQSSRDMNWVIDINQKLSKLSDCDCACSSGPDEEEQRKKRSIYRVPSLISDLNKNNAYMPQVVSFGPYHHGEDRLKPMEDHKQRALLRFLRRLREQKSLKSIFNSLLKVAQELKDSYDSLDSEWLDDNEGFVQLMIVDGCFMLEILRGDGYADDDPIFGHHGKVYVMPFIRRDMLLLENQLPMLVLVKLLAAINDENAEQRVESLNKLILGFCNAGADSSNRGECLHVLDLHRKSLLKKDPAAASQSKGASRPGGDGDDANVRSATELREAGIRFKNTKSKNINDISFEGWFLKLPTFIIDDATESTFLNLIAFERCHVGAGHEVTSFICFMDNLVDNARDISLLCSKGIIQNVMGSDKAAAELLNTMTKDLAMDPDSELNAVHRNVTWFCKKPWNRWRANFTHTYFTSPWALVSVLAAFFLFALTIIQTVFSVLQYKQGQGQG